ncbi:MAG: hypothetical protein IKN54_08780 [Lachnospiraceae bacterium]|nr:hypothetical protein [Lachnospiraceae bacterium]
MEKLIIPMIIIIAILAVVMIVLYFVGKRLEKKQSDNKKILEENAQTVSVFIIDKKKLKMKDSGLPAMVIQNVPKFARGAKVPIVKVRIQGRIMNLICEDKIYPQLLPNQDGKAVISGIYLQSFKRIRGPVYKEPEKKKHFWNKSK